MSGRPPEWLRMTREWRLSELTHWTSLKETLEEIPLRCSTGKYYSNPGLLNKNLFAFNSEVSDLCPENIDRFLSERTQPDRPGYRSPPAILAPSLANPTVPLRKPEAKPSLGQP